MSVGTSHRDGGKLQVANGAVDPTYNGSLQIDMPSNADGRRQRREILEAQRRRREELEIRLRRLESLLVC